MGVITNGAGGGGGGNVRYDPTTDMVQIKYNGVWTDWKSGNMQRHYVYRDGERVVPWGGTATLDGYSTKYANYTDSGIVFKRQSQAYLYQSANTLGTIDMTDYSTIGMECTYNGATYTYTLNISSLSGAYYLWATMYYFDSSYTGNMQIYIVSSLTNVNNNVVKSGLRTPSMVTPSTLTLNKVWLE